MSDNSSNQSLGYLLSCIMLDLHIVAHRTKRDESVSGSCRRNRLGFNSWTSIVLMIKGRRLESHRTFECLHAVRDDASHSWHDLQDIGI